MPTLHTAKPETIYPAAGFPIDVALRRLSSNLARAVTETAGAFFNVSASLASRWEAPRIPELGRIHCSQRNLGEKYEMMCNLIADRSEWGKLFPADVSDQIKLDAYSELANCMCGTLLADAGFTDWFGYLIPCVPCSGAGCTGSGAHAIHGALKLSGAWILYSFAVKEAEAIALPTGAQLTAAA